MNRISHSCEFVEILTIIQCICSKSYIMAVHKGSPPVTPSYWKSDWTNHWTVHLPSIGYWWSHKHWHALPISAFTLRLSLAFPCFNKNARWGNDYHSWHWPPVNRNGCNFFRAMVFPGHHFGINDFASVGPTPLALGSLTAWPSTTYMELLQ